MLAFDHQDLEWIEFFAGCGRASLAMKGAGVRSTSLDIAYGPKEKNYMDLLTPSGMACKPWLKRHNAQTMNVILHSLCVVGLLFFLSCFLDLGKA